MKWTTSTDASVLTAKNQDQPTRRVYFLNADVSAYKLVRCSMEPQDPARYRVLDIDIISSENLSPLATHLNEKTFILGCQKVEGLYYLSFEPDWLSEEEDTPENSSKNIINLLLELRN